MLSQTKKNQRCFSWNFFPKNRKGISIMIGYILLVTVAVVMGVLVYNWIKTYVPQEALECPDTVSIFIERAVYYEAGSILNVTIKNNGNFNIAGYFIHATNSSEQELAMIDLSNYTSAGQGRGGTVLFSMENSFEPNGKQKNVFNLSSAGIGQIYSIEITPVRFQEEENKIRFVSCGNARVRENVDYWEEGVPETCEDGTCDAEECDSCPQDCSHADCCGDGTCNNDETCGDTDTEPECNSDCEACPIVQIEYIGFEESDEINNWKEDPTQSAYGEILAISGPDECNPKAGSHMLSGRGNFWPLARYNRTLAIDVTDYEDISIQYSMASEDTEWSDRIEFYYYDGSSWELCNGALNRNGNTCAGWEDFECNVNLDSGVTDLFIGVAWKTSSSSEHAFWDDINITGTTV